MRQLDPSTDKTVGIEEANDQWQPAGTYKLRIDSTKQVSDGLNGSVLIGKTPIAAIGAELGEEVKVRAKANGKTAKTTRNIHTRDYSLTLPSEIRQELQLSADDEVRVEIAPVEKGRSNTEKTCQETINETQAESDSSEVASAGNQPQETLSEEKNESEIQSYAAIRGSFTYHFLRNDEDETTICGVSLAEHEHRRGEEPIDMFEPCFDCRARSGAPMTNEEEEEWLSETVGFEQSGGPPAYFKKDQLQALREYIIELQDRAEARGGTE